MRKKHDTMSTEQKTKAQQGLEHLLSQTLGVHSPRLPTTSRKKQAGQNNDFRKNHHKRKKNGETKNHPHYRLPLGLIRLTTVAR